MEHPKLATFVDYTTIHAADAATPEKPYELLGFYLSAPDWCRAQHLMLDHLADVATLGTIRRAAKGLAKTLSHRANGALTAADQTLLERSNALLVQAGHGNSDTREYTVFHTSGARAVGTRKELLAATGLSMPRLKDLLGERRRLVKGWTMTAAEARRGRLPSGPKRKAPEPQAMDFVSEGVDLF